MLTPFMGPMSKVEATLRDPSGSIQITLWEQYTNQVQGGKTCAFKNVKVGKNGVIFHQDVDCRHFHHSIQFEFPSTLRARKAAIKTHWYVIEPWHGTWLIYEDNAV